MEEKFNSVIFARKIENRQMKRGLDSIRIIFHTTGTSQYISIYVNAVNIFVETHRIKGFKTVNLTRDLEGDLKVQTVDMS